MAVIIYSITPTDVHGSTSAGVAGRTGSPGDGGSTNTCARVGCHTGGNNPVQNSPNVVITTNIPVGGYVPGQTYTVTVQVTEAGRSKFGFSVTAERSNNAKVGTWVITNPTETQANGTGNNWATHTTAGTAGTNSKTWSVNWVAPAANTGTVTFYAAGNAANGSGSGGDIIGIKNLAVQEAVGVSPPTITNQPQNVTECVSGTVSFNVTAAGTGTLTYQWKRNGNNLVNGGGISGATSATLSISNITAANQGNYTVDVTNSGGTTTSNPATLTVSAFPTFSLIQPPSTNLCVGQSLTLGLNVSGGTVGSYQWFRNNTAIPNSNVQSLTINPVTLANAGTYYCQVTGTAGCADSVNFTENITINVTQPVQITSQTANQTLCVGQPLNLIVAATGTTPTFQWRLNNTNLIGQTNDTLSFNSLTTGNSGTYTCVVSNSCGSVTSNNIVVLVNANTAITTNPTPQAACVGNTATFSVAATGAGLTYQWRKNSVNIPSANSASYTTPATVIGDNGANFDCIVTGTCGTLTTTQAALTVTNSAAISQQPQNVVACAGGNASFTVSGTGGNNTTYQWRFNGNNIGSPTSNPTLQLSNINSNNVGNYDVVITGGCGTVTSTVATLSLGQAPTFTPLANTATACLGTEFTTTVATQGQVTGYVWRKNGTPIPNQTTATLTLPSVTPNDAGTYSVSIVGTCGNVFSNDLVLSIINPPVITVQPSLGNNVVCVNDLVFTSIQSTGDNLVYQWYNTGQPIGGQTSSAFDSTFTQPTTLSLYCIAQNSCGEVISDFVDVQIVPLPTPTITQTQNVLSTQNYVSYQWFLAGNPLGGATNQTYEPALISAPYTVSVVDTNGCSNSSDVFNFVPVSVIELSAMGVSVFPIPTSQALTIQANETIATGRILTTEGRVIRTFNFNEGKATITVNDISTGVYLLEATNTKGLVGIQRIMINR